MTRRFHPARFRATVVAVGPLIWIGGLIVGIAMSAPGNDAAAQDAAPAGRAEIAAEGSGDVAGSSSAVTAEQIRDALVESAKKLVDLKITVVERGDFIERAPDRPVRVVFKEMWLHGASMQVRMDSRDQGGGGEWWTGFESRKGPITSADLTTAPGVKECVDMSRDMVSADSRPLRRRGPSGEIRTLHSLHKDPWLISNLFVPLVELDKPWIRHPGGSPVVNHLARLPLSAWHLLGEDKLGDEDAIRAEVHLHDTRQFSIKRDEGEPLELALTPMYLVWFAKNRGFMPLRIEKSQRYGYQGRDYEMERRPDGKAPMVYEASDFVRFNGVWVPRVGRQCTYQAKRQDEKGLDLSRLAEEGAVRLRGEWEICWEMEWRILDLQPIEPSVNLWFEPQDGAEVVDMDNNHRWVQGDAAASAQFAARERAWAAPVGQPAPDFPKGATWLNGEPLTWQSLRGKVVILDFWADSCGACMNALPELRKLHDDRQGNGLAIIGVHLANSELADVKKAVDRLELNYPICVDVPRQQTADADELKTFPSEMTSKFAINAIPHFVVVDQRGIVAASLGDVRELKDALAVAEKLINAAE